MDFYDKIKHEIGQKYYAENYSNDGQRFVAWYLRNIYGLSEYDARDCITDGAGDKQIDAVYVDHSDEKVYVIQGKFTQKAKADAKTLEEVFGAWVHIQDMISLQDTANDKLKAKVNDISSCINNDYELSFELVTTSELTKSARNSLEIFTQKMANDASLPASLVVVDEHILESRYNQAMNISGPCIDYSFSVEPGSYMDTTINGTRAVIAVISIRDCAEIPGIQDGALFRRNVRQSLGNKVKVNRSIAETLKKNPGEFLFLNNGITAICESLDIRDNVMSIKNLNVVNGCQTLTAIYNNSGIVKKSEGGYVVFRFYVIRDEERAEAISVASNSQNGVKARDLVSNHKYILRLRKSYEHAYTDGQIITKRGEKEDKHKNKYHVIDLTTLGKMLLSWYLQRLTVVHEEVTVFTQHFNKLFQREYTPEKIQALNEIFTEIMRNWKPEDPKSNPLDFNETLFRQKAYVPYLHLYAVSVLLKEINKIEDDELIPAPDIAIRIMKENNVLDDVIAFSGACLDEAFMSAAEDAKEIGTVFNPSNWPKTGQSMKGIRTSIRIRLKPTKPDKRKEIAELRDKLKMSKRDFEQRTED